MSQSYRGIFGAVFILSERLLCAAAVFLIYYYCYAILGMELFSKYNLESCCKCVH
jgi:two pore calcium channel protein 1